MKTGMEQSMNHLYEPTSFGSYVWYCHWSIKKTFRNKMLDKKLDEARLATMMEF